jgi:O-Antigen ligase
MDSPLLWLGTLACASFAALALLPMARPARLVALATALLIAPVLILGDEWDSSRISDLRDHPSLVLAALVIGAVGLVLVAVLFRKRPLLLAPALIATMPFRIPIDLGSGEDLKILLPLYAVIAAAVIAALIDVWRAAGEGEQAEAAPVRSSGADRGWLRWIGPTLAAITVLYALQAGYADDLTPALQNVAFFLAPFSALYFLLERTEWNAGALRVVVWVLAAEGLIFVAVGAYQYVSGDLFWNDKVISGNEAHAYFRVNSLFFDPNILGRYLVVSMTALAAIVAYGRRARDIYASGALFALLLVLLVFSFSQTSTIALFAALLVLIATRWGLLLGLGAAAATVLALAASIALVAGGGLSSETTSEATSGRAGLIDGGLHIAEDHPLIGVGSGGFAPEFTSRYYQGEGFAAESHTEPVTVAAEQGLLGLAAFATFLVVTVGALLQAAGVSLRERARGTPLAATLLAIYVLMLVHSLGYAAFLIDPITWAVLAIATAALVRAPAAAAEHRAT